MTPLLVLLLAAPTFDGFDEPLDPARWYVGVPQPPKKGVLRIPKGGWIVSRSIPGDRIQRLDVHFRSRGGSLELAFFAPSEPLSSPRGEPIVVKKGTLLTVAAGKATLDGAPLAWEGKLVGTFRLRALKGNVELDEVEVSPRIGEPEELGYLERRTLHLVTTPQLYEDYRRVTLTLWDVEVCVMVRRGDAAAFAPLAAAVKGAPTLGALATLTDGSALARAAASHPLAMNDWRDEQRNLRRGGFLRYIEAEYRLFEALQQAQRALNAALPERKGLDALVHLAVIRHADNAHAAVALAETQEAKSALAALRKALHGGELRRASSDALRAAAGEAARAILRAPPAAWRGFKFDPQSRSVTIQQAKELVR